MVYLHFPSQLTEEEEMLQKKYQKLKRKKKALQQLRAPKQEPPPVPHTLKRSSEAKVDAKEVAKKLLKSGAISAIKVDNKERQGFKRPKALERKRSASEKSGGAVAGYQPFVATHAAEENDPSSESGPPGSTRSSMKSLYESFVSARRDEQDALCDDHERDAEGGHHLPRQGNTLYVHGYGITEEILRSGFEPFGNIINISMEMDKNCGFVTFEKVETAERAIREMNGNMVSGVQLRVSLARRQPLIGVPSDASSSASWSSIAERYSQKRSYQDSRDLVTYDDLF